MHLKSLNYIEFKDLDQEWSLNNLNFKKLNLLVGINATGKTRTLNVIGSLARVLSDSRNPGPSGNYDVVLTENSNTYNYKLKFEAGKVIFEELLINNVKKLTRDENGEGTIFYENLDGGKDVPFKIPDVEFAIVKKDELQHKFLEPLHIWGESLRQYFFGSDLGKENLVLFSNNDKDKKDIKEIERDASIIGPILKAALDKFGEGFKELMYDDLDKLGYPIEDIGFKPPLSVRIKTNLPSEPLSVFIKEKNINCYTDQFSMSQGLFRSLCILIRVNYFQLNNSPVCLLIDDIGEGLDYERSCALINILREKVYSSDIQLIMSTNDRFVMNEVPLKEWTILVRDRSKVVSVDADNSPDVFEDFKYTGLNNFDFFTSKYYQNNFTQPTEG